MSAGMRIKNDELRVGHWVQFYSNRDLVGDTQYFLVVAKKEPFPYYLISFKKKVHHYIASANTFDHINLASDVEIRVLTRTAMESIQGTPKIQAVYSAAAKYITKHSGSFACDSVQLLFPLAVSDSKQKEPAPKEQRAEIRDADVLAAMTVPPAMLCIIC